MKMKMNGLVIEIGALLVGFSLGHWVMPSAPVQVATLKTASRPAGAQPNE